MVMSDRMEQTGDQAEQNFRDVTIGNVYLVVVVISIHMFHAPIFRFL
jgi:hypothetical protein